MRKYRIGTRKSELAKYQGQLVIDALGESGISSELVEVGSPGDKDQKTPLYQIEASSPGLFTKQLEKELLHNNIDLAVHSLKDVPTEVPAGLNVVALSERSVSRDCLLISIESVSNKEPFKLGSHATVGTSSLRRQAEITSQRPDIKIIPIRGNIETRVRTIVEAKVDAVVLAEAGLVRLGKVFKGVLKVELPEDIFVPAPGQGVIAVESRTELDSDLAQALKRFHDAISEKETRVERAILRGLEGGCTLPLGVRCYWGEKGYTLKAFLGIERERGSGKGEWKGFHHFGTVEADEDILVQKTVQYFKEVMERE